MTGFKDGAATSGLDDDDTDDEDSKTGDAVTEPSSSSLSDQNTTSLNSNAESSSPSLPWIYRRSGITDGREKTVQLHLQQSTLDDEYGAKGELEERLGESVQKADLREAAYLVGLSHLDEVAAKLREWGHDIE